MLGAVYLQIPDRRLLKIQYFIFFFRAIEGGRYQKFSVFELSKSF